MYHLQSKGSLTTIRRFQATGLRRSSLHPPTYLGTLDRVPFHQASQARPTSAGSLPYPWVCRSPASSLSKEWAKSLGDIARRSSFQACAWGAHESASKSRTPGFLIQGRSQDGNLTLDHCQGDPLWQVIFFDGHHVILTVTGKLHSLPARNADAAEELVGRGVPQRVVMAKDEDFPE
jgi:hypothetical protein